MWPLPFDLSGMDVPTRSVCPPSIALWVTEAHKPPLHEKVVALEQETFMTDTTKAHHTQFTAVQSVSVSSFVLFSYIFLK
jgi:hypothetical protein